MERHRLLLLPFALACLMLAACGSEEEQPAETCDDVECGANEVCDPETLECICAPGFTEVDGECIDSKTVECNDVAPENATSEMEAVEVTWSEESGWTAPALCEWTCDEGFGLHSNHPSECLSEVMVLCDSESVTAPENATLESDEVVTITWEGDVWSDVPACEWRCDAGYAEHESREGECLDTVQVPCDASVAPENSDVETEAVEIVIENGEWTAPAACDWTCQSGYAEHESALGECADVLTVSCVDVAPENADSTAEEVVITWDEAAEVWSDDSCPWACLPAFGEHESVPGACLDEVVVDCVDNSPEGAEPSAETVLVTWDEAEQAWSDDSCPFECMPGFHQDGEECIENVAIDACALFHPMDVFAPIERELVFQGVVKVDEATGGDERLAGITGKICFAPELTLPLDIDTLFCVDAAYAGAEEGDDLYETTFSFDEPGQIRYVFAASGDGGETWLACDLDGVVEQEVHPGVAMLVEPINADFEEWGDDGQGGQVPLFWDFAEGLIVERGEDHEDFGGTVLLTRDTTSNGEAEVSSGLIPVEPDTIYSILMIVHDDDPDGRVNTIYQWFDAAGESLAIPTYPNNHSEDQDDWQMITRKVGAPSNAAFLRLATRLYAPQNENYPGGQVTLGWLATFAEGPAVKHEPCIDEPPEGAYTVDDTVTHAVRWSDRDQAFPEAELCPWECMAGWEAGDDGCYKPTVVMWDFGVQGEETFEATAFGEGNEGRLVQVVGGPAFSQWVAGVGDTQAPNFNGWNGKAGEAYWLVSLSTLGFSDLELYSWQRGSNTGPRDFQIQYSLDGIEWHDLDGGEIAVANNWTSGAFQGALPAMLANQPLVHIRWLMTSEISVNDGTVAGTGTSRISNVTVRGTPLPL